MKSALIALALVCAATATSAGRVSYIDSAGRLCTRSFIIADDGLVHFDLLERPKCTERRLPKAASAASAPPTWLDYLPRK